MLGLPIEEITYNLYQKIVLGLFCINIYNLTIFVSIFRDHRQLLLQILSIFEQIN